MSIKIGKLYNTARIIFPMSGIFLKILLYKKITEMLNIAITPSLYDDKKLINNAPITKSIAEMRILFLNLTEESFCSESMLGLQ